MADIKAYTPTDIPQKPGQVYPQTAVLMQRLHEDTARADAELAKRMEAVHDMKNHMPARRTRVAASTVTSTSTTALPQKPAAPRKPAAPKKTPAPKQ